MKYRLLGKKGPKVSILGLGCMGMSEHYGSVNETESLRVLKEAYEGGITFFDTADMYGKGENEKLVGKGVKSFRDKIILATKCALEYVPDGLAVNNDPAYIRAACDASLNRLGMEKIDVYYLHRHNPVVPIEESMGTMLDLIKAGKIDYVGLSEVGPTIIHRAHQVLGDKLVALQSEYSIMNRTAAELILPTCRELGIAFVAFSPLTRGLLSGKITDNSSIKTSEKFDFRSQLPQFRDEALEKNLRLVHALEEVAKQKKCTVAQIALAYLFAKGDDIFPIPGTKKSAYLKENIGSVEVSLSLQELASLEQIIKTHGVEGARLPESMATFNWNG